MLVVVWQNVCVTDERGRDAVVVGGGGGSGSVGSSVAKRVCERRVG